MAIATQFCFESGPVIAWADRLAEAGIDLPIHIGVAGPAKLQTMIKFAIACGVGPSLRVLATACRGRHQAAAALHAGRIRDRDRPAQGGESDFRYLECPFLPARRDRQICGMDCRGARRLKCRGAGWRFRVYDRLEWLRRIRIRRQHSFSTRFSRETLMTRTVLESKTKTAIIGFDQPFCVIGERINPTGRKKLAAEMQSGRFLHRRSRCRCAGRGGGHGPGRECGRHRGQSERDGTAAAGRNDQTGAGAGGCAALRRLVG